MSPTGVSQAAAKGALGERPLPRLLHQLFRKRVTGRLVVTDDAGDASVVLLREGIPVHVDRPNDLDRLDRILAESGAVPPAALAAANAEAAASGRRLGDLLVERGALRRETLADLLKVQLRRKLVRLFFTRRGTFEVFLEEHGAGSGADFATMRVDPRTILYPGIRAAYDDARLTEELKTLAGRAFRLGPLPPSHLEAMGIAPDQPTVAALRGRSLTVDDLPAAGAAAADARSVVLSLLYADLLELADAGAPAAEPVPPRTASPRTAPPAAPVRAAAAAPPARPAPAADPGATPAALRARLEALDAALDGRSFFELLEVPETATAAEVGAAYRRGMRQLHPDRLASLGLRDLVARAERVVARLGEAHAVLTDSAQRAEYVARRAGGGRVGDGRAILAAEQLFRDGERLLARGDAAAAAERFAEAARGDPGEPTYKASLAWARWEAAGEGRAAATAQTVAAIEAALVARPRFAQGHHWLGLIAKRMGDLRAATRAFRQAVEAGGDSGFLDAERELRLIEMRRAQGPGAVDKGRGGPEAGRADPKLAGRIFRR